jgi:YHS domain-containing protein
MGIATIRAARFKSNWNERNDIMDTTGTLGKRLQEKLMLRQERRRLRQEHTRGEMEGMNERLKRYTAAADKLMESIIRPRMEQLKRCFEAVNGPQCETTRHMCRLLFKHSAEFPATATVELGVTRDGHAKTVLIQYDASILPRFVPLDDKDELGIALESLDQAKVAAWVEDKLLQFVDVYLSLETTPQYQAENLATDPVCGMSVNKVGAPARMDHRGKTYFFCVEECRQKFAENPGRYL